MITSIQNPRIQQIRGLIRDSKERKTNQLCVVEGIRLVEEAVRVGIAPSYLLYINDLNERGKQVIQICQDKQIEALEIAPELLQRISDTEQPQGILGVFPIQSLPEPEVLNMVVILDAIRDPGNMGTILRTAAAAGIQAIWMAPGCTDPFSPKVLRSGMGAHFHIPVLIKNWDEISSSADCSGLHLYLADSGGGMPYWQTDLSKPVGLIICNEAEGATPQARTVVKDLIHIPMPGKFESLNASTAAAVIIFEAVRQRNNA